MSHARDFGLESGNQNAAEQIVFDYRECGFDSVDMALCQYAVDLTKDPGAMKQANINTLRESGLTDEQITVASQVISYFNYINRIADGLGVDDEDWMTLSHDQWLEKKAEF